MNYLVLIVYLSRKHTKIVPVLLKEKKSAQNKTTTKQNSHENMVLS